MPREHLAIRHRVSLEKSALRRLLGEMPRSDSLFYGRFSLVIGPPRCRLLGGADHGFGRKTGHGEDWLTAPRYKRKTEGGDVRAPVSGFHRATHPAWTQPGAKRCNGAMDGSASLIGPASADGVPLPHEAPPQRNHASPPITSRKQGVEKHGNCKSQMYGFGAYQRTQLALLYRVENAVWSLNGFVCVACQGRSKSRPVDHVTPG
jgi:hypothetical protein